jgi:hypothetical protein
MCLPSCLPVYIVANRPRFSCYSQVRIYVISYTEVAERSAGQGPAKFPYVYKYLIVRQLGKIVKTIASIHSIYTYLLRATQSRR